MDMSNAAVARAAGWLTAWDSHPVHRTGTAGDVAGAAWLMSEVEKLGVQPVLEEFTLDRLIPIASYIEIDGIRIEGVPVFDSPATPAKGVTGRLGPLGSAAAIGVVELSPHAVYAPEYDQRRREARHEAVVIVSNGARPGLALLNAERFRAPYGAPAIQVPSAAHDAVFAAAERGNHARVVAESRRTPSRAANVLVNIAGREPHRAPVIVMTPRSSWWQSTAERGGGLACWLETIAALLQAPPTPDVVFTANSGHELGHLGLDAFIARRPGRELSVEMGGAVCVHYGANIGAEGGELSVLSAAPDLAALAAEELTSAGSPPGRIAPPNLVPSGETRDIHRAGGHYVTLVGTNPWFHLPEDRWPHAVDAVAVARIAAGAAAMVLRLTR